MEGSLKRTKKFDNKTQHLIDEHVKILEKLNNVKSFNDFEKFQQ